MVRKAGLPPLARGTGIPDLYPEGIQSQLPMQ
jgi:hypothetical protein